MADDSDAQLEQRVEQVEQQLSKMLPGRRGVLKGLGAAALGGAAVGGATGGAAGQSAAGQIGTKSSPVDVEAASVNTDEINNIETVRPNQGSAAINDALDNDTAILLGSGTYQIDEQIKAENVKRWAIVGSGPSTVLQKNIDDDAIVVDKGTGNSRDFVISDLRIEGDSATYNNGNAIRLNYDTGFANIKNVFIGDVAESGVLVDGAYDLNFSDVIIGEGNLGGAPAQDGMRFTKSDAGVGTSSVTLRGVSTYNCGNIGIDIRHGSDYTLLGVTSARSGSYGVRLGRNEVIPAVSISGLDVEASGNTGLYVGPFGIDGQISSGRIQASAGYGIDIEAASRTLITNFVTNDNNLEGLRVQSGTSDGVTLGHNRFIEGVDINSTVFGIHSGRGKVELKHGLNALRFTDSSGKLNNGIGVNNSNNLVIKDGTGGDGIEVRDFDVLVESGPLRVLNAGDGLGIVNSEDLQGLSGNDPGEIRWHNGAGGAPAGMAQWKPDESTNQWVSLVDGTTFT